MLEDGKVDLNDAGADTNDNFPDGAYSPTDGDLIGLAAGASPPLVIGSVAARMWRDTDQSIADDTETALVMSDELYDAGHLWDPANLSRLTAQVKGFYVFGASVEWDTNTTGIRRISIRKDGSLMLARHRGTAHNTLEQAIATGVFMEAGAYVQALVYQNSGGARDIISAQGSPILWGARLF